MSTIVLKLETLHEVDHGTVQLAFDRAIAQAVRDITDRPGDKKARKVTLQISMVPVVETLGNELFANNAAASIAIKTTLPQMETNLLDFKLNQRHGQAEALFSPTSPDNIDQSTLFDDPDPGPLHGTDADVRDPSDN